MSLLACPKGCGNYIADNAKSCPRCGADIEELREELRGRHGTGSVCITIGLLLFLWGIVGGGLLLLALGGLFLLGGIRIIIEVKRIERHTGLSIFDHAHFP